MQATFSRATSASSTATLDRFTLATLAALVLAAGLTFAATVSVLASFMGHSVGAFVLASVLVTLVLVLAVGSVRPMLASATSHEEGH